MRILLGHFSRRRERLKSTPGLFTASLQRRCTSLPLTCRWPEPAMGLHLTARGLGNKGKQTDSFEQCVSLQTEVIWGTQSNHLPTNTTTATTSLIIVPITGIVLQWYTHTHTHTHSGFLGSCSWWICVKSTEFKSRRGTSLVIWGLRIHLPMPGTQVWFLVQEDPTCCGASEPVCCNYWSPYAL